MTPFVWGQGGLAMTPEDVARQRLMAMQARERAADTSPVGHWTQGAARVVDALAGKVHERRADEAEGRLRSEADEKWRDVVSALTGSRSPSGGEVYPVNTPPVSTESIEGQAIADDTMLALGMDPLADPAERDLLARTLQAEAGSEGVHGMIAAGSVIDNRRKSGDYGGTFQDVIMAPGQFSAWNGVTGYAGGEQGQNMDFQPSEEAYAAADAILSGNYQDPTGGATHYFNPAISQPAWGQGFNHRIGNHVFGTTTAPGSGGRAGVTGNGMARDISDILAIGDALGNPYIADDAGKSAVLQALLQQALTPPEPRYQTMSGGQLGFGGDLANGFFNVGPDGKVSQIGGSGTNVTVNNAGAAVEPLGTEGQILVPDPTSPSGYRIEIAPNSKLAREIAEEEAGKSAEASKARDMIDLIDSVMGDPALDSVVGNIQGRLPAGIPGITGGQAGMDVSVKLRQIGGKAFLEAFETLKGGGQITEREGQAAKDAIARLERAQSEPEYRSALQELRDIANRGLRRASGEVVPDFEPNEWREINGVRIREKR